jgi:DNA ligase-1
LATDSNDHANKMTGIKRIECKLDGVRVLALCSKNRVTLYSRNGKIFENFPDIEAQLDLIKHRISLETKGPFVLDGEIVGESFQALMKQAQRKDNVKTKDMNYYIFDVIPLADFERGFWNAQQHKRTLMLDINKEHIESQPNVRIMPGMDVDLGTTQGQDVMRRFADDAVEAGYEGIMIKSVDAPYECRRSSFWMKWKPVMTVDLNIVGFEEGTGRNAGRLGAIICEGTDNDRDIRVNVGSGLSDENRDEYWTARDDLVGRVIEVAADAVTQNQDGTYSLRFPRFVRFRGFEAGEKL